MVTWLKAKDRKGKLFISGVVRKHGLGAGVGGAAQVGRWCRDAAEAKDDDNEEEEEEEGE